MRTGITDVGDNRFSYSDAGQIVTISSSAETATLHTWLWPITSETANAPLPPTRMGILFAHEPMAGDVQYILILDQNDVWIGTLFWARFNHHGWSHYDFDMTSYIGKTVKIQFGTFNDGIGGISSMYADDFSLEVCDH